MPRRIRWVVTDVDATITNNEGLLDLVAVRELRRLEERGISVGLVSGRPYPVVRAIGEYLGLTGPLIAENGGIGLWNGHTFRLGSRSIADAAATELQRLISLHPTWDNEWRATDYAVDPGIDLEELQRLVMSLNLGVELHVSSMMIHLAKTGINKRFGLEHCSYPANIEGEEIIVAGDSLSDLPLFERFKLSIAPANSCESLSRIAGFRSKASFGEGLVEGLQYYRQIGCLQY